MRRELTDFDWTAIGPFLPKKAARRAEGKRPTRSQPHLLDIAMRSARICDALP
jgi:hypothetical protein